MFLHPLFKLFKENHISISWKTIWVGRKLKLADSSFVEDYATDYLLEHSATQNLSLIELAYGVKNEFDVNDILNKLYKDSAIFIQEDFEEGNLEVKKWRYVVLKQLVSKNYDNKRLIDGIETIYCDFEHPEDLAPYVSYMSTGLCCGYDFTHHSLHENHNHMVHHFYEFLKDEQKILSAKD